MSRPVLTEIERDIQLDWANREYVELITTQIKKISDFLNSFDSRLAIISNFPIQLRYYPYCPIPVV